MHIGMVPNEVETEYSTLTKRTSDSIFDEVRGAPRGQLFTNRLLRVNLIWSPSTTRATVANMIFTFKLTMANLLINLMSRQYFCLKKTLRTSLLFHSNLKTFDTPNPVLCEILAVILAPLCLQIVIKSVCKQPT